MTPTNTPWSMDDLARRKRMAGVAGGDADKEDWELTEAVLAAAMEVHTRLGPGLLESVYERCLRLELQLRGIPFAAQIALPVRYKGLELDEGYRLDLLIAGRLVVEIKSVDKLAAIHTAQVVTYLRLTGFPTALLINFNEVHLRQGIRRLSLRSRTAANATAGT